MKILIYEVNENIFVLGNNYKNPSLKIIMLGCYSFLINIIIYSECNYMVPLSKG